MAKQIRTIGISIIQIALSLFLIVTGVCLVVPHGQFASNATAEIHALTQFIKNENAVYIIDVVIGVILIVCALLMFIKACTQLASSNNKGVDFGKVDDITRRIVIVLWIIVSLITFVFLIINAVNQKTVGAWLYCVQALAIDALIIGGLLTIKDGK